MAAEVSLENVHGVQVLHIPLNPLRCRLVSIYVDGAYDRKANNQLIAVQGRVGAEEEDIGLSPSLTVGDSHASAQAVDGGKNQFVQIQWSGRGSDDVCERDKQTDPLGLPVRKPQVSLSLGT